MIDKIALSDAPTLKAFTTINTTPCILDYDENAEDGRKIILSGKGCPCPCMCTCPCPCTCMCTSPRR